MYFTKILKKSILDLSLGPAAVFVLLESFAATKTKSGTLNNTRKPMKVNAFGGTSHGKGILLERVRVEAKRPNSAIRKCVRIQLIKNSKKRKASLPDDSHLEFRVENNEVLVAGFGCKVMLLVIFLESTLRLS